MHRIGEFASLSGLSVKTLRYYDEVGLLKPAATAAESGYRLYTRRELERAREIVELKRLGLSLEEIGRLLEDGAPTEVVLEEARRRLAATIDEKQRELAAVEARLASLRADPSARIQLRRCDRILVASVRDRLASIDDAEELARELAAAVREPFRGPAFGTLWHGCGHGEDDPLEAEVFFEVRLRTQRRGRVEISELPAVTAAAAYAEAGEDDEEVYGALARWVATSGRRLTGPKREIPIADPRTGRERLEIMFPVGEG
jgi:DNA-binding transcriptional MerR regulator